MNSSILTQSPLQRPHQHSIPPPSILKYHHQSFQYRHPCYGKDDGIITCQLEDASGAALPREDSHMLLDLLFTNENEHCGELEIATQRRQERSQQEKPASTATAATARRHPPSRALSRTARAPISTAGAGHSRIKDRLRLPYFLPDPPSR